MSITDETALTIVQQFAENNGWNWCDEYGEPGYNFDGDQQVVVFGNYWCRCKNNPNAGKQRYRGYGEPVTVEPTDLHEYSEHHPLLWARLEEVAEFEWSDEWYVDNENSKAYRTSGDTYGWQPSAIRDGANFLTPDDDLSDWIEWATSDPASRRIPTTIASKRDLEAVGFAEYNGVYENGWHPGQTDDPATIVAAVQAEHGEDVEMLFWHTEQSQFYMRFEALIRLPQYAVWWASAGCLPDNDEPCFTGSLKECEQYVEDDPDGYMEGLSDHNLYSFSIDTWEDEEED